MTHLPQQQSMRSCVQRSPKVGVCTGKDASLSQHARPNKTSKAAVEYGIIFERKANLLCEERNLGSKGFLSTS